MAGTLTVSGLSAGELAGERIFGPITMVGKAVIGETLVVPLTAGENTFAVPTEAIAVLIVPPFAVETTIKVKTNLNASDAGLPVGPSTTQLQPFVYSFPGTIPTSLILHPEAAISVGVSITFI